MAPASNPFLGVPGPWLHAALIVVALCAFGYIMARRAAVLRLGAPDPRFDRIGDRLRRLLVVGFGQSRQPRYPLAGTLHIVIFAGFLVLSLRSLTLLGEGFRPGFSLPLLSGQLGELYGALKDWTAVLVLLACVVAGIRRAIFRPARYHDRHAVRSHGHEAYMILAMISTLMIADALFEGTEIATAQSPAVSAAMPLASTAALLVANFSDNVLRVIHLWAFWVHNVVLMFFLCYLPLSKHFHVITSLPNVFLSNIETPGHVKPPRHDMVDLDEIESLGVGSLEDFTWKHLLDFYSCTDCGRCSDACPAYATGTPLSPRMISIKSRDLVYDSFPILGAPTPADQRPELIGEVISEDEIWACTTCGACEEACPVLIEYVDKIIDMRRFLVDGGEVPASLQKPLADLEKRGNPYGKPARKRGDWVEDEADNRCGVRILKRGEEADTLFFTDSCAAYDPRIQEISRAFGRILEAAGVDVGTLGRDEVDSGHEARRLGEEGLFETLRDANLEAIEEREIRRVVTCDPHAFNTLRNDYDSARPVEHHTEVLARLVESGEIRFGALADGRKYTFHDPCYIGRHNGIYDAPRRVLDAIPGIETVEMERSRNRSFCCGGGSLYLFYEGESESRMGEIRADMADRAGADVIVTACPFCLINLEDAIKTTGRENDMEVIDIAELVQRSVLAADDRKAGIQQDTPDA